MSQTGLSAVSRCVALAGAALLTACSAGSGAVDEQRRPAGGPERTLVLMNLCLSGLAPCAGRGDHGAAVTEGIALIRENDADLAVVTEACSHDARHIAWATGLHLTFSVVRIFGSELPCVDPGDRGVFGNAVLTGAAPVAVRDRAYRLQSDEEERRVGCVRGEGVWVCGTHLSVRGFGFAPVNDAQCAELAGFLGRLSRIGPALVAGDMNRREPCAPSGWWSESDADASQLPGVQHVYGDGRLAVRTVEVQPTSTTDHDALVVRFSVPVREAG